MAALLPESKDRYDHDERAKFSFVITSVARCSRQAD